MIPVLIIIGLIVANFAITCSRHGELKKPRKHDAWVTLTTIIIQFSLYYWAGLFDVFIK